MKGINIFLADGFEDIEALATNDVLRRAGLRANLIAIGEDPFVISSHGLTIGVDNFLGEMEISHNGTTRKDVMVFPGGMPGSKNLASCKRLINAMKDHYKAGGTLAAICAAPGLVLSQLGSPLEGVEVTCFDGFEEKLEAKGASFSPKAAIRDGQIITGRSSGHSIAFALEIVAAVKPEALDDVKHGMFLETEE